MGRIKQYSDERCLRKQLFDQLEPFGNELFGHFGRAGDIPTGVGQTAHESRSDRVENGDHYDGGCLGRLLCSPGRRRAKRQQDIDFSAQQFVDQTWEAVVMSFASPILDREVLPYNVRALGEGFLKDFETRSQVLVRGRRYLEWR